MSSLAQCALERGWVGRDEVNKKYKCTVFNINKVKYNFMYFMNLAIIKILNVINKE